MPFPPGVPTYSWPGRKCPCLRVPARTREIAARRVVRLRPGSAARGRNRKRCRSPPGGQTQLVSQAEVDGQPGRQLPTVLGIKCVIRVEEIWIVPRGDRAAIDCAEQ